MIKVIKYILILFLVSNNTYSQKLEYSIFSEPYNELVYAINEQPFVKYDSGYTAYLNLPFTFVFNEIVSEAVDIYGPAYANLYDITDTVNWNIELVTFYPFTTYKLVDKSLVIGQLNNLSSFTHKTDIVNGEKIYKLQWKNMGFNGCSINDSLNMQLWIFEHSNKAQFRYGKSNMTSLSILNNPDTPIVAVEVETLNDYYYATFNGSPSNYTWGYMDPSGRSMGIPPEGMVIEIRSTESPVSVDINKTGPKFLIKNFSDYLEVQFQDNNTKLNNLSILDVNGSMINNSDNSKIDISFLDPNVFILKMETNRGTFFRKFMKM